MKIQKILAQLNKKALFPSFKDENHYYFYLKSGLSVRIKREKDSPDDLSIIAKSIQFDTESDNCLTIRANWNRHDSYEFIGRTQISMSEINDMLPIVSTDRSRYVLNGVYFNEDGMAATDGARMIMKKNHPSFARCDGHIFSGDHLKEFKSFFGAKANLEIQLTDDVFYKLEHDGMEIQGRFVDGIFPNFIQVVPENKSGNHFRFSEEFLGLFKELKSTYGNVDFILNTSTKKVRIEGNDELLDFNPDWITVERGEYPKFGVNLKFLNDFLKIGLFDFSIEDDHSPLHFSNDKYEAVLMPMRIR